MAEKSATEVTAARVILSSGQERRLYTVTPVSQGDHSDLSTTFEKVYFVKAWVQGTGVDIEAYVADEDFAADDITFNNSSPALSYLIVEGTPVKSTGGAT